MAARRELTSVTTPLAAHVTLHTTVGTTMRQVMSLPVPAGGSLALGLGGDHLMLENLTRRPAVGDKVTLDAPLHPRHACHGDGHRARAPDDIPTRGLMHR